VKLTRTAAAAVLAAVTLAGCADDDPEPATPADQPADAPAPADEPDEPPEPDAPDEPAGDTPSETPASLAAWACDELRSGVPEQEVTPELARRAERAGVDLLETLGAVEELCPELLL
jgi:hypothetical protein